MFEKVFGTRGRSPEGEGKSLAEAVEAMRDTDEFKRFASIVSATERTHDDVRQEQDAFVDLQEKLRETGYNGEVTLAQLRDLILSSSTES